MPPVQFDGFNRGYGGIAQFNCEIKFTRFDIRFFCDKLRIQ